MTIRGKCETCGKTKWFVRHRTYIMPKISPKPIKSMGKLCGDCFKTIKKITLHT